MTDGDPSHWSLLIHPLPLSASLVGTTIASYLGRWKLCTDSLFSYRAGNESFLMWAETEGARLTWPSAAIAFRFLAWFDILSLWVLNQSKTLVFIPDSRYLFIRTRGGKRMDHVLQAERTWMVADPSSCITLLRVSFIASNAVLARFNLDWLYTLVCDYFHKRKPSKQPQPQPMNGQEKG